MTDIESILKQMTLDEKAALCTGAGPWTTLPIERLGVPAMTVTDGPHGVRRTSNPNDLAAKSLPATCFPTASSLACTWDRDLLVRMGEAMAEEAIALGVDVLLGPSLNMKRSPLCGRNFEYFSEDPVLAGEMAASLVEGIQSKGVGTSLKHYALNNQETRRLSVSAQVEERAMREVYLPAFEIAVKRAEPWTVMCAYNKVNGTYCAENHLMLSEILKDEWGFEGLVMSDWGAVHDRVKSLAAGLDLEMPGPKERHVQALVEAVRNGELDEKVLDEAVRRNLRIIFKAAEIPKGGTFDLQAHHELARKIAGEGMVLLKNNGLLPLKGVKRIAVIGRSAKEAYFQGGGASHINPTRVSVPYIALQTHAPGVEFSYAEGYTNKSDYLQPLIDEAAALARQAEVALVFIAPPASHESEGYDRPDMYLLLQQVALIEAVAAAQPNTVVVLNNGSPVEMSAWIKAPAAVLEAWMMGQAGGEAIADVLFGQVNPSGKLAETFPVRLEDTPAYLNWPGENDVAVYGEGIHIGYRYYEARDMLVQFPFGHGLSYTQFTYSNPRTSAVEFIYTDGLTVSVDVTNTGQVAGSEVVQLYVRDVQSGLKRPPKELKGFARVDLQPGEKKTVAITLDFRAFAYYHPAYHRWITEDGEFELLIGASSADIRERITIRLHSSVELPCILNHDSSVTQWMDDPRGKKVLEPILQPMMKHFGSMLGGDGGAINEIGMNMLGFMRDMPLYNLLQWQEDNLPKPAEEMLEDLLAQAHA
jgi:beta-glucosidase